MVYIFIVIIVLTLDTTQSQLYDDSLFEFGFPFSYHSLFPAYLGYGDVDSIRSPSGPRSNDTRYRLPRVVSPLHYDIEITPYFKDENGKEAFTLDGMVTIVVKNLKSCVRHIILHENVANILEVTVTDENGRCITLNKSHPFKRIKKYNFLKINLDEDETLPKNAILNISIEYTTTLTDPYANLTNHGSKGFYAGRYKDNDGNTRWYASSNFEPTHARRAFPCFDEPGFKSTFKVIVNRPASFSSTYTNTKVAEEILNGDRIKEVFHTTPKMSTYLVTFLISEDFKVKADKNNETRPFRIIARPSAGGTGDLALKYGIKVLEFLKEYFGIDSYTMGDNLNEDIIAVPDMGGAMENWGSIHFQERRLLDDDECDEPHKFLSVSTVAHEIIHKWFGNLVTCQWWDNTWLNEGFAKHFQLYITPLLFPSSNSQMKEEPFITAVVPTALALDSTSFSKALKHTVNTPLEAAASFHSLTYRKGAAFLIMLKYVVSERIFKKTITSYLEDNAYKSVVSEDLYNAFKSALNKADRSANIDIEAFMRYWVEQPGHPVLNVDVETNTGLIKIKQERFFINGSTISEIKLLWYIPLTFTTEASPDWDNVSPSYFMTDKNMEIQGAPGDHWVIFNLKFTGFYRVSYDKSNWQKISRALKENPSSIHVLNRIQIVCDVFAFMESKRLTYGFGFQILDFLKQESNEFVWKIASDGFSSISTLKRFSLAAEEIDTILLPFMDSAINSVGYKMDDDENLDKTSTRISVMSWSCKNGHQGCIRDAIEKFTALKDTGVRVNPNYRAYVYCTGIRYGNYEDWLFLKQKYEERISGHAKSVIVSALACTINEQALKEYLKFLLENDERSLSNEMLYYLKPITIYDRNSITVLNFVKENTDDLRKIVLFEEFLAKLSDLLPENELNDMEQWLSANEASIPESKKGLKAIGQAREALKLKTRNAAELLAATRGAGAGSLAGVTAALTGLFQAVISNGIDFLTRVSDNIPSFRQYLH